MRSQSQSRLICGTALCYLKWWDRSWRFTMAGRSTTWRSSSIWSVAILGSSRSVTSLQSTARQVWVRPKVRLILPSSDLITASYIRVAYLWRYTHRLWMINWLDRFIMVLHQSAYHLGGSWWLMGLDFWFSFLVFGRDWCLFFDILRFSPSFFLLSKALVFGSCWIRYKILARNFPSLPRFLRNACLWRDSYR